MPAPTVTAGVQQLTVSWSAATIPSGSIAGYEVQCGALAPVAKAASARSHVFTGLAVQSYGCKVRAQSDKGVWGEWSPTRSGTPQAPAGSDVSWNGKLPLPAGSQTVDCSVSDADCNDLDNGNLPLTPLGRGGVLRLINHAGEWDQGPGNDQWAWIQMYDDGNDWNTCFYPQACQSPYAVGAKFYVWSDGPGWISWGEPVGNYQWTVVGWNTNGLESPGAWGDDAIVIPPNNFVEMEVTAGGIVKINKIVPAG
jgi:hypothetical protein